MTEGNYFQRIAERMGLRYIPLPGVSIKYLTPLYLDELQVSRIASSARSNHKFRNVKVCFSIIFLGEAKMEETRPN